MAVTASASPTASPDDTAPKPTALTVSAGSALAAAQVFDTRFRWLILVGLILAAAMEVLDTSIINVALTQMAGNLGTTTQEIAWVSTAYILSNVIVLPMTAFLNKIFGRRNYLTGSIVLFTIASFFCGTSHSLGELIFWRLLQGAGGAALISTAQAALVQIFPAKEQAIVQPIFLMGLIVFPTLGPALGGYITDSSNWNWCFFINIPIGMLAAAIIYFFLHDTEPAQRHAPADWLGIALLATTLGSFQYVLEEGEQDDWFANNLIVGLSIVAAVALVALLLWLLSPRNRHPILNLRVLKNSSLTAGIVLFIGVGFGLYGVNYLFPLLAQQQFGMSASESGLCLVPGGIATAVSMVVCSLIGSGSKLPIDARLQTLLGIALSVIGSWGLAQLTPQSNRMDTFLPLLIRGFSLGFLFVPANALAIGSLEPQDVNEGVSLLGLGRQLGGSIGLAIIATMLDTSQHSTRANLVGYLTTDNPAYNDRISSFAGMLHSYGSSLPDAQHGALGLIDQTLTTQVSMLSYNHTFAIAAFISAAMVLTLPLLKKPKPGAGAGASAMH